MRLGRDFIILACLFVVMGWALLSQATARGIGVSPDSVGYLTGSSSLVKDQALLRLDPEGNFIFATNFPPAFPLSLAVLQKLGLTPDNSARALNTILFCLNGFVVMVFVYMMTSRSIVFTALAGYFFFSSKLMLYLHAMAWTEPLYIFLSLLGIVSLGQYLKLEKLRYLWFTIAFVGVAVLTRYAGVSLLLTGGFILLFLDSKGLVCKFKRVGLFLLAGMPLAVWLLRNEILGGNAVNRGLAIHLPSISFYQDALNEFAQWILCYSQMPFLKTLGVSLCVFLIVLLYYSKRRFDSKDILLSGTLLVSVCYFLIYVLFIVVIAAFGDGRVLLDFRTQGVLFPLGLICLMVFACDAIKSKGVYRCVGVILICAIAVLGRNYFVEAKNWVIAAQHEGLWYKKDVWQNDSFVKWIKESQDQRVIYSNGSDVILYLTDKPTRLFPEIFHKTLLISNENYEEEIKQLKGFIEKDEVVLYYFNNIIWREFFPSREKLENDLKIRMLPFGEGGWVYPAI